MAKRYQSTFVGFNKIIKQREKRHTIIIPDEIFDEIRDAGYPNVTETAKPFIPPYPAYEVPTAEDPGEEPEDPVDPEDPGDDDGDDGEDEGGGSPP